MTTKESKKTNCKWFSSQNFDHQLPAKNENFHGCPLNCSLRKKAALFVTWGQYDLLKISSPLIQTIELVWRTFCKTPIFFPDNEPEFLQSFPSWSFHPIPQEIYSLFDHRQNGKSHKKSSKQFLHFLFLFRSSFRHHSLIFSMSKKVQQKSCDLARNYSSTQEDLDLRAKQATFSLLLDSLFVIICINMLLCCFLILFLPCFFLLEDMILAEDPIAAEIIWWSI